MNAIKMLKKEHREVEALFKTIQKATDERLQLLTTIEEKLRMHMAIEEEVFYPAVRAFITAEKIQDQISEAYEERVSVESSMRILRFNKTERYSASDPP